MTDNNNEPTTLAERLDSYTDSIPSEATDTAVSGRKETLGDGIRDAVKRRQWQAWRAAWNQRGSTDSMSDLEERTARTEFEQWWEKDA